MRLAVLLGLLSLPLSLFKEADDLTGSVRQYNDGFVLGFALALECFLGPSIHGFDPGMFAWGAETPTRFRSSRDFILGALRPRAETMAPLAGPRQQSRPSALGVWRNELQLSGCKRAVDRALGFRHGFRFDRRLACRGSAGLERNRPFPELPPQTLNDRIFDASIFHAVRKIAARVFVPPPSRGIRTGRNLHRVRGRRRTCAKNALVAPQDRRS
jgi:hypothetical protein